MQKTNEVSVDLSLLKGLLTREEGEWLPEIADERENIGLNRTPSD